LHGKGRGKGNYKNVLVTGTHGGKEGEAVQASGCMNRPEIS